MKNLLRGYSTSKWSFRPHAQELKFTDNKKPIKLPFKVANLLELLCKNDDKFVDRNQLFDELWDGNYSVGDRGLRQVVFQLRKALASDDNDSPVINIPRKGYKLSEPVEITQFAYKLPNTHKTVLVVLSLAVFVTVLFFSVFDQPKIQTVLSTPVTTHGGLEEALAISPDGKYFLYNKMKDGEFKIYKSKLTDKQNHGQIFISKKGDLGGMEWNHSGDKVAYLRNSGERYASDILIYDLASKAHVKVAELVTFNISQSPLGIAWSPIENKLAYTAPSNGSKLAIYIYDANTGLKEQLSDPVYMDTSPQWNLDGSVVTFNALNLNYKSDLFSIDLASKKVKNLTNSNILTFGHTWVDDNHILFSTENDGAYEGNLLDLKTLEISKVETAGNFQFPQRSGSDIYYLRSNQELQMKIFSRQDSAYKFKGFIDSIGNDFYPVIHETSERMVFLSDRTGSQELWYKENGQSVPVQITNRSSTVSGPSFSADGSRLSYHWFNKATNQYQLGLFNLSSMQEMPIAVINTRNGVFAAGNNYLAYLTVTDHERQLWTYDMVDLSRKIVSNNVINIVGASPTNNEVYFDIEDTYLAYDVSDGATKVLAQKNVINFPFTIHGTNTYYEKKNDGQSFIVKLDTKTNIEETLFPIEREFSEKLSGFAVGNNERHLILSYFSKNEGDIYKFPIEDLFD